MERIDTPPDLRLEIDENNLDKDWQGHAEQAFQWSRYAAMCHYTLEEKKAAVDLAAVDLKRVVAELDDNIRREPHMYGISAKGGDGCIKMTETVVANAVLLQPKYNKKQGELDVARSELSSARYTLDVAEAAVSALKDRKHGLQDICVAAFVRLFRGARRTEGS